MLKEKFRSSHQNISTQTFSARGYSPTTKLIVGAIYAALAAVFQSAGVFTGIGYAFSILATLPIVLSALLSVRIGILSYILTTLLLWIFQPSELLVFPFTTGLLGMALGCGINWWKGWISSTLFGGAALTAGIFILLFIIQFPVLGPSVSHSFNPVTAALILLFSLVYSLIWVGVIKRFKIHLQKVIRKSTRHPD